MLLLMWFAKGDKLARRAAPRTHPDVQLCVVTSLCCYCDVSDVASLSEFRLHKFGCWRHSVIRGSDEIDRSRMTIVTSGTDNSYPRF